MDIRENIAKTMTYAKTFIKWLTLAGVVGILCGLIGTAFRISVDVFAAGFRQKYPWLLYLLPFGGLLIAACYHAAKVEKPKGTNLVIRSIRSGEKIPFKMLPLIFIGTTLTHLFGGSTGKAGAALQIGGSLGANLGRIIHLNERDMRLITLCGMSSLFSTLYGTPLTAALFAMEVISVGIIYYTALVPCILGALLGHSISVAFGMKPVFYHLTGIPELTLLSAAQVILFGIFCALLGIVFCIVLNKTSQLFQKCFSNAYLRIFVGGCIIAVVTLLLGCYDYNGVGLNIIGDAMNGSAKPDAFLWKMLLTAISLGAGYKGGEIAPTFFIGATFGNFLGSLLGLDPGFGAALGLIGLFCAVVNCPIASIVLSVEMFGSEGILLFALVSSVSYMLSGYYSLYSSQKIVYSKLSPEYLDKI